MITVGLKIITHLLIVEEGKQSEDNIVIVSTPFPILPAPSLPPSSCTFTMHCKARSDIDVDCIVMYVNTLTAS